MARSGEWESRSQCWWGQFLVGVVFRFADGCLAVPSQGRKINSLGSSYKGTNPILGLDLHVLITSQRLHFKYFHTGVEGLSKGIF